MRPMWAIAAAGGLAWGGWSVWNSAIAAEGDAPKPAAKQAGEAKQPATKAEPKPAQAPKPPAKPPLPLIDPRYLGVDQSELPVRLVPAFTALEEPIVRPIVLTHAGDGTNRVFVASQLGKLWVMPNRQEVTEPTLFLDWEPKTTYKDKENEEGLLGWAFHPKYKENGKFYVYYTSREKPNLSVISELRVSKDDPNKADPASERELLRIQQPFWNHNGGTLCFGPDGFLYIALGDGGKANDVFGNGQNLSTLLGSILRIDVDAKTGEKAYGIPQDNPFVGKEGACPEIYAYGVRNPWRIAFDRKTGTLWCADVGQDLWEEINLIVKGGNYGWNKWEGRHPFGTEGGPAKGDLVDPIWEYHHSIGKSITGGSVYRGTKVPELAGHYLYADYVTGRLWALHYDETTKQVKANRSLAGNVHPVLSFGEDEQGEIYFLNVHGHITTFGSPDAK